MNTAKFVKKINMRRDRNQVLYRLSEPLDYYSYVMVSAGHTWDHGDETYIFGANEEGEVLNWGELTGSYTGGLSHKEALAGAGYEIEGE